MRNLLLLAAFIFSAFSGLNAEKIIRGSDAAQTIPGTELIRYNDESNNPVFIQFSSGQGPLLPEFVTWMKSNLKMEEGFDFEMTEGVDDQFGWSHFSFHQSYQGTPIEFAIVKAHVKGNRVFSISGNSVGKAPKANAALSETEALNQALSYFPANVYKWQVASEEQFLKAETGNPEATYFPQGELRYLPANANFTTELQPCWKFNIYSQQPLRRADIYVSAADGSLLLENARLKHADTIGTALTAFSGTRDIVTDYVSTSNNFRLREAGRGLGIRTFDMLNGTSYNAAADFFHMDNDWPDSARIKYATDAHWGAEMTYDYYLLEHGRNSIDGNGFMLRSYVHYDVNYNNAFWDGQRMTYGDGSGSALPYTTLDITGHEITHGLTDRTADLIYANESGALNESFSDLFGCAIEYLNKPDPSKNWLMGEDRGNHIRSMSNPKSKGDPDTYLGGSWYFGTADNGGVHTNSGVQNHWFYLLSIGGSGTNDNSDVYSVTGLGVHKASTIAFRNLTVYLSANSDYFDARFFAIQSAIDLYGSCSPELESTVDAWYAVGVGDAYQPGVVSEFSVNTTSPCNLPAVVQFTNLSNYNAKTYVWDFGDGQTSTSISPSHSYANAGTYTVKLTAVGDAACGQDIETKNSYVNVSPPADASANDITICDGDGAVIRANAQNTAYWYINPVVTSPIHVGSEFRSAPLYADTQFYVQNVIPAPVLAVGPPDNTFGGGGNFNNDQYLIFDALDKFTLQSVKVYAQGAKFRTVELRDNNGVVLQTRSDYIEDGEQVFELGFIIQPGTDYRLAVLNGSNPDLYRNNSSASYPYTIPNVVSIKRSSAGTGSLDYYYYFYDWRIKQEDCFGKRLPVKVFVDYDPNCVSIYNGIDESQDVTNVQVYPNPSSGHFRVNLSLKESQDLSLRLVNANGTVVARVPGRSYAQGDVVIPVKADGLSSGIYVMVIEGTSFHHTQRIAIE